MCGSLLKTTADTSSCDRNCVELKGDNIYHPTLTGKVCQLCCAFPTFLPEGLITLENSAGKGVDTRYLPFFSSQWASPGGCSLTMWGLSTTMIIEPGIACPPTSGRGAKEGSQCQRTSRRAWGTELGCPSLSVYCGGSSNIIAFVY